MNVAPHVIEATSLSLIDEVLELEQACYEAASAYTRADYKYALDRAVAINLHVRGSDGTLAGFAGAFVHRGHRVGHVYTVNVHPRDRGKGLGRALMDGLESRMREFGMSRCALEVNVDNTSAIGLYESLGYSRVARLKDYYQTYANPDAFRYVKEF